MGMGMDMDTVGEPAPTIETMTLQTYSLTPIGIIHTPFRQQSGTPIQARATDECGQIELFPEYLEGLADLSGFSHIYLIYVFHQIAGAELKVTPFLDTVEHGIFATRSPKRPNRLGLSIVRILDLEKNLIRFEGADMLDGTPLIDIKPYVPDFDHFRPDRIGWYAHRLPDGPTIRADDRFDSSGT